MGIGTTGTRGEQNVSVQSSSSALWTARIVGGVMAALLFVDAAVKLLQVPQALEGTRELGYPEHLVLVIGIVEMVCIALYVTPRTAVLGAVLLTGYLGGAVATHLRIGSPLLTHTLAPVIVGVIIWGALVARDSRLRALMPYRRYRIAIAGRM